ncbi:MAG TPA: nucleotidyl transferase AbiEii/AbiGii toxin family protein [Balneolaceae bacterium]
MKKVARGLTPLLDEVVFTGGAIIELYADESASAPLRPTTDIDIVIEVVGYGKFAELEGKLSKLTFYHDLESSITCRYRFKGIKVDIMPTDEKILGFSNRWHKTGMEHVIRSKLAEDLHINLFEPSYFLASKFEAFSDRGDDRRTSHDFEDIVYFLDNRENWIDEISRSEDEVKSYLKTEFKNLIDDRFHREYIAAHLPSSNRKEGLERILSGMKKLLL